MALFQTSVLKKYLAQQDTKAVDKAYRKYTKFFLNLEIQQNIDKSNEEQIQATFLTELFVNVLDYTINPKPKYNLTTEYKNEKNNRKADGAIITEEKTVAVVELKGTNTKDLESIRRQAFDYKVNHKGCRFVITSNFEKLRFYIDDTTELLDFDLFNLTRDDFGLLYLSLHKDNLLKELPLQIKQDSIIIEEEITKDFYKDYSLFKRELYRDLVKKNGKVLKVAIQEKNGITDNAEHRSDLERLEKNVKLTLFKKSQKLIDRFLFIFFAEDRGLLQPNYTIKRLAEWDTIRKLDVDEPLYDRFKKHFNYLDKGRKGDAENKEIFAYNGGLFKPDSILDRVIIDDELLYDHTKKLATYDFESQVDVNILGHIFENSLNEIESINAEIEGGDFDKQKSKRKKDGVFYTPKYITKYIVENTVGKLCDEKKAELGFKEEEYFKGRGTGRNKRNDKTIQKLVTILDDYRDWLLQITICDPACGSGAFLNQALDFLIKEHQYIDELKTKILGGGLQFPDIENTILENNIYGVDLNEESVEIAKLSLWLRTAQPRRKLNDLSSNIKCGNSLINSKTIAGDKAFNWDTAFAKVFNNGGFDVVIGNPPYVRQELLNPKDKLWLSKNYEVGNGTADLYVYFYEKSLNILQQKGILGFITPNKFYKTKYGSGLRNYLKNFKIIELVDFFELKVFEDAATDSQIAIIEKSEPNKFVSYKPVISIDDFQTSITTELIVDLERLNGDSYVFIDRFVNSVVEKITNNSISLKKYTSNGIEYGIKTGFNQAFIIDNNKKNKLVNSDAKSSEILRPYIQPTAIGKWAVANNDYFIISTTPSRKINIDEYPSIKSHFESFGRKRLEQSGEKGSRKKTKNAWFETSDTVSYIDKFDKNKIIYIRTAVNHNFYYDEEGLYVNDSCYIISPADKFLSAFLNSSIFKFYKKLFFVAYGNAERSGRVKLDYNKMVNVPVPILNEENKLAFNQIIDSLKDNSSELQSITSRISRYIIETYNLEKLSKKLQNWQDLDFGEFIKELNKAIKATNKLREKEGQAPVDVLTKTDELEWLDLFEQNKKKAQELQSQINTLEQQIDAMVYELYGLSDEEIRIVENG